MLKLNLQICELAVLVGLGAVLTGCTCLCPPSEKAGFATIVSQPTDQWISPGQDATFKVKAKGNELSYKWFFQDTNGVFDVPNGQGPTLVVPAANTNRTGFYWCLIDSEGKMGVMQTRTRPASLLETPRSLPLDSTNVPPPQPGLLCPSTAGSNLCCNPICGLVNFQNSGQLYFFTQGQTVTLKLTSDSGGLYYISTLLYEVQWIYGGIPFQTGCCTTFSQRFKQFIAPAAGPYAFTVYIKNNCPAQGTPYWLWPQ
jgi:hypothetical protein